MSDPKAKGPGDVLTPKQEAFALAYVETGNATEAYRRAYDVAENARDSWVYVEAAQLLDHPKIAPRIAELNKQAREMAGYTLQTALDEYEEARIEAVKLGQSAAAVSAVSGKVKLFGLDRPRRVEVSGPGGSPIQTEDVTEDKLIEQAKRLGLDPGILGLGGGAQTED